MSTPGNTKSNAGTPGNGRGVADSTAVTEERRRKARIYKPFPARIWGIDSGNLPFNVDCVVDNLSGNGVHLGVWQELKPGTEVKMTVHLVSGSAMGATAALSGRVLRDELQPDGRHGVAVAIETHKFL